MLQLRICIPIDNGVAVGCSGEGNFHRGPGTLFNGYFDGDETDTVIGFMHLVLPTLDQKLYSV